MTGPSKLLVGLGIGWIFVFAFFHSFPGTDTAFSSIFCVKQGLEQTACDLFPARNHWLTTVFRPMFYWVPIGALIVMVVDIAWQYRRNRWADRERFKGEVLAIAAYLIGPILLVNGVLKAYFVDDYYGRKLKMAPTTASASNLVFAPGKKDLAALLADVKEGVLVTGFLGGNSNATTGDYSFGIQGFRIRGGKKAEPVSETNIAGNQRDLWKKLAAVGSDPWRFSSTRAPTLVFEGVQLAGA